MPAWETYYRELLSTNNGHAVWNADPGSGPTVDIADVGYMERGAFIRLFNAAKELGDISNEFGTPDGYQPLRIGAIGEGTISATLPITSETVLQRRVEFNVSGGSAVQSGGGGFVFECTKEQGAVLILGDDADRRDTLQKRLFIRYMVANHRNWLKFANDVHERGVSLDQLVLVTGCDRTSAWACAAFSASSNKLGLEFHIGNGAFAQGGISVWGSWNNCQSVQVHSGPRVRQSHQSDSQRKTNELEAVNMLHRDPNGDNGVSTTVDGINQSPSIGRLPRLANRFSVEQENTTLCPEEEGSTTESESLYTILRCTILIIWLLGYILFCILTYFFSVVSGRSLSHLIPPFRALLAGIAEPNSATSSPAGNDSPSRSDQAINESPLSSPTITSKAPSSSPRNQCVFVRGFKICDRPTMKKRIRFFSRKPPVDGFTPLTRKKRDDKEDPGRSSNMSSYSSSYSLGNQESSSGRSESTKEDKSTGSSTQSQYGSQYSLDLSIMTPETDSLSLFDIQSEHEFDLYQQCTQLKEPTHLDILMKYILENSSADLALVHHDDLATFLEYLKPVSAFESVLSQIAPTIFIENGVGMLENTFRASQDTKATNDAALSFTPNPTTQVATRRGRCKSRINFDLVNSKLLASALSRVTTEMAAAMVDQLSVPWALQAHEDRCANSSLHPSHSAPIMALLDNASQIGEEDDTLIEKILSRLGTAYEGKRQHAELTQMVSLPAANGPYFELSQRSVKDWVDALCNVAPEPPNTDVETFTCRFVTSCFNSESGFKVISSVLSDRSSPVGISNPRASSNITRAKSGSFFSSSIWGSGISTGKSLKRLGEKVMSVMGYSSIMTRGRRHISLLRKWKKGTGESPGFEERVIVLEMLQDALEMSRQCYSARLNRAAYEIGRRVQRWLQSFSIIPNTPETTQWLIQIHVSLLSLLLSRISHFDPIMQHLADDVSLCLTRIPISLQEHSTPAAVICLVINELSYSRYTFQHSWLGVWLARIVELSLTVRRLTDEEVKVLLALAMTRKDDETILCGVKCCRPWEVALFSQVAMQETRFKPFVLDTHGFPSLINALDCMLSDKIDRGAVHWNRVALTLRALSFSLEQDWIASIVKPKIILSLLRVFRRSIPEKWFCIRFWAADAIRNLVAHQPSLVQTLLDENAVAAIMSLANPKLDLRPGHPVNRRVNVVKTSVQNRLFEDYKREGVKRAAELAGYVAQWTPESLPASKLKAVTPGWSGYLGGIEESSD